VTATIYQFAHYLTTVRFTAQGGILLLHSGSLSGLAP
jgi:hypothetical protein